MSPKKKKRSHKKMEPEIKALYAIVRALENVQSWESKRRVIDYIRRRYSL